MDTTDGHKLIISQTRENSQIARRSNFSTILAYVSLGLVLLGAITGVYYIITMLRPPPEVRSWADAGPAFLSLLGLILADAGALLALIGAITAEFASRPRYLWIAMIVVCSTCILSFLGVTYYSFFNTTKRVDWSDVRFELIFLLPLVACVITGIIIGTMRKLKKPKRR